MAQLSHKVHARFKKLHETLEIAERDEKINTEKVRVCDKLIEIYKNKEIDIARKSEMFIQVLEMAQRENADER